MTNLINEGLDALPGKISAIFDKLDDSRQGQLSDIKTIREHIYGRLGANSNGQKLDLPDIYEQAQTLKAHMLENLSSHPEGLFDVTTSDIEEQENAIKQKAMLNSAFEQMGLMSQLEKIVDNLVETGECSVFIGWQKTYKQQRVFNASKEVPGFEIKDKLTYDGPILKTISPEDFVFDTKNVDNWENCTKIYRTHRDFEDIKTDKIYNKMTSSVLEELEFLATKDKRGRDEEEIDSKKVELLEYWGDIEVENGKVLKNQLVVVAARRFVIRLEANPYLNSPFVYANIIENPFNKRGISPLKAALALNTASNKILNNQLDAYALIINPPYLAPKGAFKGEQSVQPGKIIEYDSSLLPQTPSRLDFSQALCGWDFIKYFKSSIESTTGIFKTMAGNVAGASRTATEVSLSAGGQSARLNMFLDAVNRKILIPIVKKTADTIANFKYGKETVFTRIAGVDTALEINDKSRFGDYKYRYSDRKAALERQYKQKELAQMVTSFASIPDLAAKIDWVECFKLSLEQFGIENSEMYLKKEDSSVSNPGIPQ